MSQVVSSVCQVFEDGVLWEVDAEGARREVARLDVTSLAALAASVAEMLAKVAPFALAVAG